MSEVASLKEVNSASVSTGRQNSFLGVHAVNVYVRDQDQSIRFFVDQLGFNLAFDGRLQSGDRWVAVAPPDGTTVLALIVPKADSQQISGALGLAVLSTIAANQTKGRVAAHHGATASLISGYHLAFLVAAGATLAAILLALWLLTPHSERPEPQLADEPTPALATFELEHQAA